MCLAGKPAAIAVGGLAALLLAATSRTRRSRSRWPRDEPFDQRRPGLSAKFAKKQRARDVQRARQGGPDLTHPEPPKSAVPAYRERAGPTVDQRPKRDLNSEGNGDCCNRNGVGFGPSPIAPTSTWRKSACRAISLAVVSTISVRIAAMVSGSPGQRKPQIWPPVNP